MVARSVAPLIRTGNPSDTVNSRNHVLFRLSADDAVRFRYGGNQPASDSDGFPVPILEGFGNMVRLNNIATLQVGDGTGEFQDAVESTSTEV